MFPLPLYLSLWVLGWSKGRLSLCWLFHIVSSSHALGTSSRETYPPSPSSPGHLALEARASILPSPVAATVATTDATAPALPWLRSLYLPPKYSRSLPEAVSTGSCQKQFTPVPSKLSPCLKEPPALILDQVKQQRCPSGTLCSPAFWASACVTGQAGIAGLCARGHGKHIGCSCRCPFGSR